MCTTVAGETLCECTGRDDPDGSSRAASSFAHSSSVCRRRGLGPLPVRGTGADVARCVSNHCLDITHVIGGTYSSSSVGVWMTTAKSHELSPIRICDKIGKYPRTLGREAVEGTALAL